VITEALATDTLRLSCVAEEWEVGSTIAYGSSDPESLRPYLSVFYLPTGVKERALRDARRVTPRIAPNPCRNATTVNITPSAGRLSPFALSVYDASGRLLLTQPVFGSSVVIRTSEFPSGVCVVELRTGGSAYRRKLVVR
jgi:hypothetical protein